MSDNKEEKNNLKAQEEKQIPENTIPLRVNVNLTPTGAESSDNQIPQKVDNEIPEETKKPKKMTTISEILDIEKFSGKITDANKFRGSVRAGYQFVDATNAQNILRYLNGAKNKLDSISYNTLASVKLETLETFVKAIEDTFLISNDPSNTILEITMIKQKPEESMLTFANNLL